MTEDVRTGCDVDGCGWHSDWRSTDDPLHRLREMLDVMGHMRDNHHDVYAAAFEERARTAFEAGVLAAYVDRLEAAL